MYFYSKTCSWTFVVLFSSVANRNYSADSEHYIYIGAFFALTPFYDPLTFSTVFISSMVTNVDAFYSRLQILWVIYIIRFCAVTFLRHYFIWNWVIKFCKYNHHNLELDATAQCNAARSDNHNLLRMWIKFILHLYILKSITVNLIVNVLITG